MIKNKKVIKIILWVFFIVLLGLSIVGLQFISTDIVINFSLGGNDLKGSKYFIFMYPAISLFLAIINMKDGIGTQKNMSLNKNPLLFIVINLVLVGAEVYTILAS